MPIPPARVSTLRPRPPARSHEPAGRSVPARAAGLLAAVLAIIGCRTLGPWNPLSREGRDCRHLVEQAVDATDRGDLQRAHELLAQAVARYPEDPDAHAALAEVLRRRGRFEHACAEAQLAAEAAPDDAARRLRLAELALEAGRFDLALQSARHAIELLPDEPRAHLLEARALEAVGHQEAALAAYYRVLEDQPDHREALWSVAQLQLARGRQAVALTSLRALLALEHNAASAARIREAIGLACLELARWEDAAQALELAHAGGIDTAALHGRLAYAYSRAGDSQAAEQQLAEALARDPHNRDAQALRQRMAAGAPAGAASRE